MKNRKSRSHPCSAKRKLEIKVTSNARNYVISAWVNSNGIGLQRVVSVAEETTWEWTENCEKEKKREKQVKGSVPWIKILETRWAQFWVSVRGRIIRSTRRTIIGAVARCPHRARRTSRSTTTRTSRWTTWRIARTAPRRTSSTTTTAAVWFCSDRPTPTSWTTT